MAEPPIPETMPTSPISPRSPTSPQIKLEKIEPEIKAAKCGVTLFEYKCGHSTRYMAWNPLCGAHEKCDPHSAVMEVVGTACARCGVVDSVEDGLDIKKENDTQLDYASSLNGDELKVITATFNLEETAAIEALSGSSRDSSPFSVLEDSDVRGALSDIEEEPAPFAPVHDKMDGPSTPTQKHESDDKNTKVTNGAKKQEVNGSFEYMQSPVSGHGSTLIHAADKYFIATEKQYIAPGFEYMYSTVSKHAPVIKLPGERYEHTDLPSTPASKNASVVTTTKLANAAEEPNVAGGFEYMHSPLNKHAILVKLPTEKDDDAEAGEKSIKNSDLQATAEPFVPIQTLPHGKEFKITSSANKHNDFELNDKVARVPEEEEVTVKHIASLPKPIKVLDRCSRFQPLDTHVEAEDEITEQKKPVKYTPPMFWKQTSANKENNENTSTSPKVKEGTMMKGKSVDHGDQTPASSHRTALSPILGYNNKIGSQATHHESLEYNGNALGQEKLYRAVSPAYPLLMTGLECMSPPPAMKSHPAAFMGQPCSSSNATKSISNGVHRNKVPFLPTKSESVTVKEERMDAEAEKLKKLQRTLATLAITQEVDVIFAKVQREQKIQLEDWFANVAPMHLAVMEKATKQSRDRDTQIKALRASFADNGKFLGGMLVDQLLADAKAEVIRMCEEGVEKLVNSLL